jgi:hypothetical protein
MWHLWRIVVLKPGGKRPLGRPRHRWQDDNVMDFASNRWEVREWINVAQDRDKG